jgi:hypothetical protein
MRQQCIAVTNAQEKTGAESGIDLQRKKEVIKLSEAFDLAKEDEIPGYWPLHSWVRKRKHKSSFCECCGCQARLDLANISQKYKKDISDWEYLCRSCHMEKDGRKQRLAERNKLGSFNRSITSENDFQMQRLRETATTRVRNEFGRFV